MGGRNWRRRLRERRHECRGAGQEPARSQRSIGSCAMRPKLTLLDDTLRERIVDEAFELISSMGAKVGSTEARDLLGAAGASVAAATVRFPQSLVRKALESVPREFFLYD